MTDTIKSIAVTAAKGTLGIVAPIVATPPTFEDYVHVLQALLVIAVSSATFISIILDIARKRREAIDEANRRDREVLAMDFFRARRAGKKKHIRRIENHENNP